ncbi:TPA: hypothetical protein ACOEC5_004256, partial [Enterobacter roggenkampii]
MKSFEGVSHTQKVSQHQGITALARRRGIGLVSGLDTQELPMLIQIDVNESGFLPKSELFASMSIYLLIAK